MTFRAARGYLTKKLRSAVPPKAGRFAAPQKQLAYEVDLAKLARRSRDIDRAVQVGDSFLAPLSNVLLVPEPLTTDILVTVRITADSPLTASVGLTPTGVPNTYRLMAHEIPVATYLAFGRLREQELDVGDSRLKLAQLDGKLDQSFDELSAWVHRSASAVRDFYGVFPTPRASVTVLPVPEGNGVLFGKVLPESSPGIALLVGRHTSRQTLYADWILVHELFHLGFPSFFGEGKWLDEGLATYYEPIIRVRAGLLTETELWDGFESSMPQGLPAFAERGLERVSDYRGVYWGGAIACLLADVEARKRRQNAGLELGLRALRDAGGNACEVWSLADAMATIDHALGAPTLAPIAKAHALRGAAFDLGALFRQLGVTRDGRGHIQLSDSAPLAAVRRAIARGS